MIDIYSAEPVPVCERAGLIARGVLRLMETLGYRGLAELPLASGRRADIAALGPGGEVAIVEIKSGLADFASDRKWPEYAHYCDRFYFAVDAEFPRERLPEDVGLIVADGFGGAVLREAQATPLCAARRKAMTLRFARAAAARLSQAG